MRTACVCVQEGYTAEGVELNHWLNVYARLNALRNGVGSQTAFHTADLWSVDYSKYDDVVVFGVSEMMGELYVLPVSCQSLRTSCHAPLPHVHA